LGYARARRDLSCVYTLGFYDTDPEENRRHEIRVRATRPGLRVLHPASYTLRSPEVKLGSALRAAFMAPEAFPGGPLRVHLFPLRPASTTAWDAILSVEFSVELVNGNEAWVERDVGGTLRSGSAVIHSFNRRVSIRSRGAVGTRDLVFVERVRLEPGEYTLTAVMAEPDSARPRATKVRGVVPEIPRRELFLVGPILGRRAGDDVMVFGQRGAGSHEKREHKGVASTSDPDRDRKPLLVHRVEGGGPLLALTQACAVKAKRLGGTVERVLTDAGGTAVGTLPPIELDLEERGNVRCQTILDLLPAAALSPGRYVFTSSVSAGPNRDGPSERTEFLIAKPAHEIARSP
jgi:hypothetical protein